MIHKQKRVAVLYWRLGPYHHARLKAAAGTMELFAFEACGMENTYAWEMVEGATSFARVTLTDREEQTRAWRRKLRQEMTRTLDNIKPQVVVVPGWSSLDALAAFDWCLRTRTPAVVMSESTEWDEGRSAVKEFVKRRLVQTCSAALAGGTPHKSYLVKLGLPAERIFLGYDAVDNRYFADKVEEVRRMKDEGRTQFGLPENYFLASARFVEKKNLPRLLQAYARYRELAQKSEIGSQKSTTSPRPSPKNGKGIAPWDLVLLGDGPLRSSIFDLRSSLGLEDSVLLPGFKQYDELPTYYGLANAFVHASTTEQWGLVVNEAMASGLPVLVSNRCGCAMDLVKEGVNGFTFDPYNVEQLAQLLVKLSTLNSKLSTFGEASRQIISHWGTERFADGLSDAVEAALDAPLPRPAAIDRWILRLLLVR
jgi:1,2-diacylglycerol 3-alpha-glucosyltransferase